MSVDYAAAGRLLATLTTAWQTFDGDTFTSLFSDRAELSLDPFGTPLVGHNALRAMLLENSREQDQVEITTERHWVSGATVLASFHVSLIERATRARLRVAGFLTLELTEDGRIERLREWTVRRSQALEG